MGSFKTLVLLKGFQDGLGGSWNSYKASQDFWKDFQEKVDGFLDPSKHSSVLEVITRSLRGLQESFKILQGSLSEFQALSYMYLCLSETWSCPATWGLWRRKTKMELHGDSIGTPSPRATSDVMCGHPEQRVMCGRPEQRVTPRLCFNIWPFYCDLNKRSCCPEKLNLSSVKGFLNN